MPVRDSDGLILLTSSNKIVRIGVDDVRSKGRATMGVMLVRLDEGAHVVGFDRVDEGGQTGIDATAEMDDDDFSGIPSVPAGEPQVLDDKGAGEADDEGEE